MGTGIERRMAWILLAAAAALAAATAAASVVASLPDTAWLLDEGAGTSLAEWKGTRTGQIGGPSGPPAWSADTPFAYGGNFSLDFSPSGTGVPGNWAELQGHPSGSRGTVALWVKDTDGGGPSYIMDASNGSRTLIYRYPGTENDFGVYLNQSSLGSVDGSLVPGPSSGSPWTHVAMVWDSSLPTDREKLYVNGKLFDTKNVAVGSRNPAFVYLGCRFPKTEAWGGRIDEYALWRYPLSPGQVRWLASHPLTAIPDQPAPPSGGWLFDEGHGRRAVGRFGPDGTLSSGVAWSTDTPRGGAGDHSVWFDGPLSNDNRVTIPGLSFGTEGSLQVWAYKERNVATTRYVFDSSGPRYLLYGSGVGTWDLYMNSQRLGAIPAELIPLEEWTHLVITWDESLTDGMRQKIYRNGRLFHHFNATPGPGSPAEFYLGNRFSLNEPWWGGLDELAFWSYALPPDQVAWLYDNSIAPLPEPTTLSLLALGGTGALLRRRRRRARTAR